MIQDSPHDHLVGAGKSAWVPGVASLSADLVSTLQMICSHNFCEDSNFVLLQGVANRDLKLENLLMDQDVNGKKPLLKICDFGYSKHEMNSSAKSGVGTPIFMAPEIVFSGKTYDAKVSLCIATLLPRSCGCESACLEQVSIQLSPGL
jgi:serine/threonine protein kinase